MHQQLLGYKVEEKLYRGVREQKRLNTTVLEELLATIIKELQKAPGEDRSSYAISHVTHLLIFSKIFQQQHGHKKLRQGNYENLEENKT
jgi:hypothetical protein